MATTRDLARLYLTKNASFMGRVGSVFRRAQADVGDATGQVRDFLAQEGQRVKQDWTRRFKSSLKRPTNERLQRIHERGKSGLLERLQSKIRTVPTTAVSAPATKPGMGLGKKLLIGGGLMAGGATMAGGAAAAKERARQPLAPPEQIPPGY